MAFLGSVYLTLVLLCLNWLQNRCCAAEPEFVKLIVSRLNTTGKVITMPLPLKDGDALLGEVIAQRQSGRHFLISAADLKLRLQVDTQWHDTKRGIEAMTRRRADFATLDEIKAAGVNLSFDKGLQELRLDVPTDLRLTSDISVGG